MPQWSRNGRELFYQDGTRLFAVDVPQAPTFRAGNPKELLEHPRALGWEIAPDGKRFLMIRPADAAQSAATLVAVVDWFEDLRRRMPVKR